MMRKHLAAACIVAPALAIGTYFAIDALVSEKPAPARAGASYPLIEQAGCRYPGGHCQLVNGNFKITLKIAPKTELPQLTLVSSHPLQEALAALFEAEGKNYDPVAMMRVSEDARRWQLVLSQPFSDGDRLHIAVSNRKSAYYGDAATRFVNYQTSYGEDFRRE